MASFGLNAVFNLNKRNLILNNKDYSSLEHYGGYLFAETNSAEGTGTFQWNISNSMGTFRIPFGSGQRRYLRHCGKLPTDLSREQYRRHYFFYISHRQREHSLSGLRKYHVALHAVINRQSVLGDRCKFIHPKTLIRLYAALHRLGYRKQHSKKTNYPP